MKKVILLFALGMAWCLTSVDAQVKTPAPSPLSKVTQDVGLSKVTIEYSRPGVKGREIFGDLVPYGEMWRTGANGSTDVEFSHDVNINGTDVPAGKYALYTIPGKEEWTVMFHKNTEWWGTGGDDYNMEDEVARFTVKPETLPFSVENMLINVTDLANNGATMEIIWDKTLVAWPISFKTDEMVMATIEKTMAGPSANDYYGAARYYYDTDRMLETAHKYAKKSAEMRPEGFWILRLQSQIEAKMGKYDMAIETATKSKAVAMEAGNQQYVKFNEEAIKEWSMKK